MRSASVASWCFRQSLVAKDERAHRRDDSCVYECDEQCGQPLFVACERLGADVLRPREVDTLRIKRVVERLTVAKPIVLEHSRLRVGRNMLERIRDALHALYEACACNDRYGCSLEFEPVHNKADRRNRGRARSDEDGNSGYVTQFHVLMESLTRLAQFAILAISDSLAKEKDASFRSPFPFTVRTRS